MVCAEPGVDGDACDGAPTVGLEPSEDVTGERGCCIEEEEEGEGGSTV